jgi:hypothetical protein
VDEVIRQQKLDVEVGQPDRGRDTADGRSRRTGDEHSHPVQRPPTPLATKASLTTNYPDRMPFKGHRVSRDVLDVRRASRVSRPFPRRRTVESRI